MSFFSQSGTPPSHFKLKKGCPIYFPQNTLTDSFYIKLVNQIKDRGFSFVDSISMLKLYMEELMRRRERMKPEDLADQGKLEKTLKDGTIVVQILRVSVKLDNESNKGSIESLDFSISYMPVRSNKSYKEVNFPFKSSTPIAMADAVEEFLFFVASK